MLGADYNRVCLLLAVLEKRAGVPLGSQDVFVNVAGRGASRSRRPISGVVVAAASSYMDRAVRGRRARGRRGRPHRRGPRGQRSSRGCGKAAALGFRGAIVPASNVLEPTKVSLDVRGVATVGAALDVLLR